MLLISKFDITRYDRITSGIDSRKFIKVFGCFIIWKASTLLCKSFIH